jgi:uncharacterized protein (TIGR02246 family)
MKYNAALLAFLFLFSHCTTKSTDQASVEKELMQLSRDWSQSAASGDIEKTLAYWADDAVVMAPGQPPLQGKKAIREMIEGSMKIPGFSIRWEPQSVFVSAQGDLAYMIEANEISMKDEKGNSQTERNKVVTIWKKNPDGQWKNVVDTWNANPKTK